MHELKKIRYDDVAATSCPPNLFKSGIRGFIINNIMAKSGRPDRGSAVFSFYTSKKCFFLL